MLAELYQFLQRGPLIMNNRVHVSERIASVSWRDEDSNCSRAECGWATVLRGQHSRWL